MPITNWAVSPKDYDMLVQVAERAKRELMGYPDSKRTLIMALINCHAKGCPLDFKGLLEAPVLAFSHDIYGIRNHINNDTGKLQSCFAPRYALSNPATKES
jgi:hypothetical protein